MVSLPSGWSRSPTASPDLLARVEHQESRGNQSAVSPKGAFGVMQLMPGTARDPGFGIRPLDPNAPDPEAENRRLGTDYLNAMLARYGGDEEAALVAYNWGPGNADKWVAGGKDRNALPRETQGYVRNIMGGTDRPMGAIGATTAKLPEGWSRSKPQDAGDFRLENKMPVEKVEAPVTAGGLAKSFATGAQKGLVGMAGLPGDVRQHAASKFEDVTGVGLPDMPSWIPAQIAGLPTGAMTSQQIQSGLEGAGLPVYEPQNTAEEVSATAGSFLPATAFGPANVARTGIGRAGEALTRAVGTGAAVEGAGRAAGAINPALEAPAQFAAAMLVGGPSAIRKQRSVVRSTEQWKQVADDAYKFLDDLQAGLSPQAMKRLLTDVATRLSKQNFDVQYHKSAVELLQRIGRMVQQGRPVRFPELQNVRTEAGTLFGKNDPSSRFVRTFKDAIDDAWATAKPSDLMGGRPMTAAQLKEAQKAVATAREAYFMQKKGELLDQMAARIESRAGQFSVSGLENAIKTEARQIVTKISRNTPAGRKLRSMFTKTQLKRLEKMAEGKGIGEIVNIAKKYGPSNSIATSNFAIGGAVTAAIMGDVTPLLIGGTISGLGAAAKAVGNRRAKNTWDAFTDTMRGGQDPVTRINPTTPLLYGAQARPALPGSGQ